MAEVIYEGGKNPMKVEGWKDLVKLQILQELYHNCPNSGQLVGSLLSDGNHNWIKSRFGHDLLCGEIDQILREMYRDGWIEPQTYTCECCSKASPWPAAEVLKHVTAFKLTAKGRDRIPEHIFP